MSLVNHVKNLTWIIQQTWTMLKLGGWRLSKKKYRMIYYLSLPKKKNKTKQGHLALCVVYICVSSIGVRQLQYWTQKATLLFAKNVKNNIRFRVASKKCWFFVQSTKSIHLKVVWVPHFSCKDKKKSSCLKSVTNDSMHSLLCLILTIEAKCKMTWVGSDHILNHV